MPQRRTIGNYAAAVVLSPVLYSVRLWGDGPFPARYSIASPPLRPARMPTPTPSLGEQLLGQWQRVAGLPFGKRVFSWMVGRKAPYTQSVGGVFADIRLGFARVELRDRRAIRNHLSSIHAVALVNVAEMTSGVALMTALPTGVRGIVTSLSIVYLKKARGTLTCTTTTHAPATITVPTPFDVVADITDGSGDLVAQATVQWTLSPVPTKTSQPTS